MENKDTNKKILEELQRISKTSEKTANSVGYLALTVFISIVASFLTRCGI